MWYCNYLISCSSEQTQKTAIPLKLRLSIQRPHCREKLKKYRLKIVAAILQRMKTPIMHAVADMKLHLGRISLLQIPDFYAHNALEGPGLEHVIHVERDGPSRPDEQDKRNVAAINAARAEELNDIMVQNHARGIENAGRLRRLLQRQRTVPKQRQLRINTRFHLDVAGGSPEVGENFCKEALKIPKVSIRLP
jgi:hypothetical protein